MEYNKSDLYDDEMDLDEQARLYEDEMYDNVTFGERIDSGLDDEMLDSEAADDAMLDDAELEDEIVTSTSPASAAEDGFHESISPANPYVDDQLGDANLQAEAEADYPTGTAATDSEAESKNESLIDKAKDKINEWTGHDKA